jgi:hypothetical protein
MSAAFLLLAIIIGFLSDPTTTDPTDRFLCAVALADLLLAILFTL